MDWDMIITSLIGFVMSLGGKLIATALVLGIGLKLGQILVKMICKSRVFSSIDVTAQTFLKSVINILIKVIVIITAIGVLGVPLTSVVTVIASCGVAVGLALQGGLSNLAGGIIIIILKPFKVGDYIMENGVDGTVETIGIFYTTLLTPDNKRVIIPNGGLMNSTVTAVNQMDTRRVDFTFSVARSNDIGKVRDVIGKVLDTNGMILTEKGRDIVVAGQSPMCIDLAVRVWSKTDDYWSVVFDINEKMKEAFDKEGIEIPCRQVDVHVKQN